MIFVHTFLCFYSCLGLKNGSPVSYLNVRTIPCMKFPHITTRKKLINDTFNASLKSYNDAFLKRHGLACHCKILHTMTLILSVIFVNQNYDIHLKRHSLLVIFQSNNLAMTLI